MTCTPVLHPQPYPLLHILHPGPYPVLHPGPYPVLYILHPGPYPVSDEESAAVLASYSTGIRVHGVVAAICMHVVRRQPAGPFHVAFVPQTRLIVLLTPTTGSRHSRWPRSRTLAASRRHSRLSRLSSDHFNVHHWFASMNLNASLGKGGPALAGDRARLNPQNSGRRPEFGMPSPQRD